MARERKGSIVERDGKLYVRVYYLDSLGKRRELMRRAKDRAHARELKKQLIKQLENSAEGNHRAELDGAKLTFRQLAERYEAVKLIPAQYQLLSRWQLTHHLLAASGNLSLVNDCDGPLSYRLRANSNYMHTGPASPAVEISADGIRKDPGRKQVNRLASGVSKRMMDTTGWPEIR